MKKAKPLKRPQPFGHPKYPAFDFYVGFGTVQVTCIRGNAVLYGCDFEKFKQWLDDVKKYSEDMLMEIGNRG